MARAEQWIQAHEDRCGERFRTMSENFKALWARTGRIEAAAWASVVALLGSLALLLFNQNVSRISALEHRSSPVTVVQSQQTPTPPAAP